jgi:hypothetical protein
MSKKIEYLTGSREAVEQLRVDVDTGQLKFYTLPEFPTGIFNPKYAEKCYSFAAAVSGSGHNDYLVVLALRPDWAESGSGKVIDIDTAAFCFKSDDTEHFPTGSALFHQKFDGRTTPLSGYNVCPLKQTVNYLHSTLIPGSTPLSASADPYLNAISHSIGKFDQLLGAQVSGWVNSPTASSGSGTTDKPTKANE